jgi:hypothetical protein
MTANAAGDLTIPTENGPVTSAEALNILAWHPLLLEHESRFKSRTLRLDLNEGSSRTRPYH